MTDLRTRRLQRVAVIAGITLVILIVLAVGIDVDAFRDSVPDDGATTLAQSFRLSSWCRADTHSTKPITHGLSFRPNFPTTTRGQQAGEPSAGMAVIGR
jgi:hypothetical protein